MTFRQWLIAYKKARGIQSVAGNTAMLRQDYEDGYTPEQAAEYNKRGYGPHFHQLAAISERWMQAVT